MITMRARVCVKQPRSFIPGTNAGLPLLTCMVDEDQIVTDV